MDSPVLYPGLNLNQRQDGFEHLASRAWKHLQHLFLNDHFVHDCLEVSQGADHVLLVLLQSTNLLEKNRKNKIKTINNIDSIEQVSEPSHHCWVLCSGSIIHMVGL